MRRERWLLATVLTVASTVIVFVARDPEDADKIVAYHVPASHRDGTRTTAICADLVDQRLEAAEVDDHDVVDRQSGEALDRLHRRDQISRDVLHLQGFSQ